MMRIRRSAPTKRQRRVWVMALVAPLTRAKKRPPKVVPWVALVFLVFVLSGLSAPLLAGSVNID